MSLCIPGYSASLLAAAAGGYIARDRGTVGKVVGALAGVVAVQLGHQLGLYGLSGGFGLKQCGGSFFSTDQKIVAATQTQNAALVAQQQAASRAVVAAQPAPTAATQMALVAGYVPGTAVHGYR